MPSKFRAALLATAIAFVGVSPLFAATEAQAYSRGMYNEFHGQLAQYGDWVYSDRWGEVWIPADVPDDFHPYSTAGHWVDTEDYGWIWQSDYRWGDIAFHYGRWVNDPYDGWLWVPGYVWSPGWVVWRGNARLVGWMPMPPDEEFLRGNDTSVGLAIGGNGFSVRFGQDRDFYGYSRWYGRDYDERRFASNWTFVGTAHLSDRDYRSHIENQNNVTNNIRTTTNITNYTVVNNYVVNRSIDAHRVEAAGGHPLAPVKATDVIRNPALVTRADVGRQEQLQAPHQIERGTGLANSAPKPDAAVVATLSTRPVERHGHPPAHLYNQTTVTTAPLPPHPPGAGIAPAGPTGPGVGAAPAGPTPPDKTPADKAHDLRGTNPPATTNLNTPAPPTGAGPAAPDEHHRNGRNGNHHDQNGPGPNATGPNGTGPNGNGTPASPSTPALTQPPTNTPAPTDNGGRHNDRHNGGPNDQNGGTATPAKPNTPALTPPSTNTPPTDNGGRHHDDRHNGGPNDQGGQGHHDQTGTPPPPPQNTPATPAPAGKPDKSNKDNKDNKDNKNNKDDKKPKDDNADPAQDNPH